MTRSPSALGLSRSRSALLTSANLRARSLCPASGLLELNVFMRRTRRSGRQQQESLAQRGFVHNRHQVPTARHCRRRHPPGSDTRPGRAASPVRWQGRGEDACAAALHSRPVAGRLTRRRRATCVRAVCWCSTPTTSRILLKCILMAAASPATSRTMKHWSLLLKRQRRSKLGRFRETLRPGR